VTVAPLVQEINLAWALAEAVKPHLTVVERNHLFVAIGAGETFPAIRHLFRLAAVKRIPLRPDLVQQCASWLLAYIGHTEERYLRSLIEEYLVPHSIHVPATPRLPACLDDAMAKPKGLRSWHGGLVLALDGDH
jgi:hypothetical protein